MSLAPVRHFRSETTLITDPAGLAALKPAWRALWQRCPAATPFQSPEWLLPWWDMFAPGSLRVIAVYEAGELTGLAPLYAQDACLRPLGVSLSDYQDVLALPGSHALPAIAAAIGTMTDIAECRFDEVPPDAAVLGLQIPGWDERMETASPCPQLDLQQRLPRSPLRHVRTARRHAARRGECVIIEGDADNALPLIAELKRLNGARQSGSVFADDRVEAFHTAAMPGLMQAGLAQLYVLTIADQMAAVYYGLRHRHRAYAYLGGFDPAFAFESPGAILLAHAIESARREGTLVYDFLRGGEAYKYDWGGRDRFNVRYVLTRST